MEETFFSLPFVPLQNVGIVDPRLEQELVRQTSENRLRASLFQRYLVGFLKRKLRKAKLSQSQEEILQGRNLQFFDTREKKEILPSV